MSDTNPVHEAFHVLRIKAGRHDDFDLEEWRDLEQYIIKLEKLETATTKMMNEWDKVLEARKSVWPDWQGGTK